MIFLIVFGFLAHLSFTSSQAIPYRYHGGRDVAKVEDRYNRFQSAKASNASPQELIAICGEVDFSKQQCSTNVGRPKDSESLACDSLCCLSGNKVGNCGSDYGFQLDYATLATSLIGVVTGGVGGAVVGAVTSLKPEVTANCFCSNDTIDVRCGRDGSFMGIRCPVDESSCWRKCCRDGKSDGKCGGFLKSKCKCS